MSVELNANLIFVCKTEEQAGYIRDLLDNLQALITCESSYMEATIQETTRA